MVVQTWLVLQNDRKTWFSGSIQANYNNQKCPKNAVFWYLWTLFGKILSFSIFKKPLNVRNWLATQNNSTVQLPYSLESNNSDKSIKIVTFLYCYKGWTDEDSLISTTFRKIYGAQIFRLTCCWYWTTIVLHDCTENQKIIRIVLSFWAPICS